MKVNEKLAPSILVSILSDVRQAASAFHDSLAKISEKALSSEGTAHSLGKPKFKKKIVLVVYNAKTICAFNVIAITKLFDLFIYVQLKHRSTRGCV